MNSLDCCNGVQFGIECSKHLVGVCVIFYQEKAEGEDGLGIRFTKAEGLLERFIKRVSDIDMSANVVN